MTTPDGYEITFSDLLKYTCSYWCLTPNSYILLDSDYCIWPGSSIVISEYSPDKEVILMMK